MDSDKLDDSIDKANELLEGWIGGLFSFLGNKVDEAREKREQAKQAEETNASQGEES